MISFHRHGIESQQSQLAQVQHDLGHAAGQKDLDCGVTDRAIRQHIYQARRLAIDARPIGGGRSRQARGVRRMFMNL